MRGVGSLILVQGTEYLFPKSNFGKTFRARIPSREEWAAKSVFRDYVISIFTNGLKIEKGIGYGIFSDDLNISVSL